MDRVWLRDYEILLSSNRRSVDIRPCSADISNNRVKKGRTAKVKKRKENFTSEADVARQLREMGTDMDEYDNKFLEKQERILFQQKWEKQQLKNSSRNKMHISFKKLTTFDEFKDVENRREQCFALGDSEIFHSLYPDIEHHMSPFKQNSTAVQHKMRPKSSPTTRSKAVPPYQLTCVSEDTTSSRPERPRAQFDTTLAKQALQLWKTALTTLRLRGKEIVYEDVSKFSKQWKKSASLRSLVVYVSILLGLKSGDPAVTQRSLFRELYSLLKFFREVNPLTLPKRRIVKANTFYVNTIAQQRDNGLQLFTSDADFCELNILGWVQAMQAIFSIILDAKQRHDIMNANFDEKLTELETEYAMMDPSATTPFRHMQTRTGTGGREEETPKQYRHRLAKLSPTGTWSTRLTSPAQMAAADEEKLKLKGLSMDEDGEGELEGGGLSAFDSTAIQSFLEVSHSVNIPLEDLSLEYSPDKPGADSPVPRTSSAHYSCQQPYSHHHNESNDPHEDFVNRHSSHHGVTSPTAS